MNTFLKVRVRGLQNEMNTKAQMKAWESLGFLTGEVERWDPVWGTSFLVAAKLDKEFVDRTLLRIEDSLRSMNIERRMEDTTIWPETIAILLRKHDGENGTNLSEIFSETINNMEHKFRPIEVEIKKENIFANLALKLRRLTTQGARI